MADLNNYSVIGRMTRDISGQDMAYTQNGTARLNISIAVNDGYGDKQYTNFFDVVVWGKTAENIKPYLAKGKQLCINGRLQQDRWKNSNGASRSRVVIVAETVQLLGGGTNGNGAGNGGDMHHQPAPGYAPNYAAEMINGADFPEDIPF